MCPTTILTAEQAFPPEGCAVAPLTSAEYGMAAGALLALSRQMERAAPCLSDAARADLLIEAAQYAELARRFRRIEAACVDRMD